MVNDPNWLYSTIAQSSAAIVAIIGGFITASVLTLAAEKRSLENQLSDKKSELKGLEASFSLTGKDKLTEDDIQSRKQSTESNRIKRVVLKTAISDLESRLKTFSYPRNLGWGMVVLSYLAVFSILLPVLMIWKEVYYWLAKTLTTAAFYVGIIGIFAYIFVQIRALRRK